MVSNRSWVLAAPLLLVTAVLVIFSSAAPQDEPVVAERVEHTEVLFIGQPYPFVDGVETVLGDLTIFGPDLIVFGGASSEGNLSDADERAAAAVAFAETRADQVLMTSGPSVGWHRTGEMISIVVDTGASAGSCGLPEEQLQMLREAVDQDADHRVLFMHHALFANPTFIDDMRPASPSDCVGDQWQAEVLPIVTDKVSVVVSGDGPVPFAISERDGIRYVMSGGVTQDGGDGPVLPTFVRMRAVQGELVVDRVSLPDRGLLDEAAVASVRQYDLAVDEAEFLDLYQTAPMYEHGTGWQSMIEDDATTEFMQRSIDATLADGGAGLPVEFSIRGNVGNHWRTYKKSWDVSFVDLDERQLKLIIPSDRGYTSQKLAQIVSDRLQVPTPDIDLARLKVNDHDFGVYLVYEDFDKAFIELAGYGSDTRPSKNTFRDHFDAFPVDRALSRVQTSGGAGDRSDQQAIARVQFTKDNMNQYFERDAFARWLAVQLFLGDKHQNEADNFRFFLDRSTGRFIMVNWDSGLTTIDPANMEPFSRLGQTFYANPENQELTDMYLTQLVADAPEIRDEFEAVINEWLPIFQNDAALEIPPAALQRGLEAQLDLFDTNLILLEDR